MSLKNLHFESLPFGMNYSSHRIARVSYSYATKRLHMQGCSQDFGGGGGLVGAFVGGVARRSHK